MRTTTKQDLIDRVAELTEQRRFDVKRTITSFLEVMVEELAEGNRIELREFGVFENRGRKGRTAQNPRTGASIIVPPRRTVKFKASRQVRDRLDKAGAPPFEGGAGGAAVPVPSPPPRPGPRSAQRQQGRVDVKQAKRAIRAAV